jgi:hypothetical protein
MILISYLRASKLTSRIQVLNSSLYKLFESPLLRLVKSDMSLQNQKLSQYVRTELYIDCYHTVIVITDTENNIISLFKYL